MATFFCIFLVLLVFAARLLMVGVHAQLPILPALFHSIYSLHSSHVAPSTLSPSNLSPARLARYSYLYTDKKENQNFLIYKEIQKGSVAKCTYNGILIYSKTKYLRISSYIRKPFLICYFATGPVWIS